MPITNFDHYTVRSGDVDASWRFYEGALGLSVRKREGFPVPAFIVSMATGRSSTSSRPLRSKRPSSPVWRRRMQRRRNGAPAGCTTSSSGRRVSPRCASVWPGRASPSASGR